jgi:hypothetical protein
MTIGIWRNLETHVLDSDLGVIKYSRPDPVRREVGQLMLIAKEWVDNENRTPFDPWPARVITEDGRTFYQIEHDGQSWKWELFEAHWTDLDGPCPCYIGKLA